MTTIFSDPHVATLTRPFKGGHEEWIIVATTPANGFTALHEVARRGSIPSLVEQISIRTSCQHVLGA
jgi:hypothetical protein